MDYWLFLQYGNPYHIYFSICLALPPYFFNDLLNQFLHEKILSPL